MRRFVAVPVLVLALALCVACPGGDDDPSDATTADVLGDDTVPAGDTATPPGDQGVVEKTCSMVAACLNDSRIGLYADLCWADLFLDTAMAMSPHKEYARLVACAASSTTCQQFVACDRMNVTFACANPNDGGCVGDALVECEATNLIKHVTDCASSAGMSCVAGKGCTTGTTCAANSQACDGDTVVRCYAGEEEQRFDCPADRTCLAGSCVAKGTPAAGCTQGATCDGDTLVNCYQGVLYRTDCAAFDRTCNAAVMGCEPVASECVGRATGAASGDPVTQDTCEGTSIKTCMNGRFVLIDCAPLGEQGTCALGTTLAGDTRGVCQ